MKYMWSITVGDYLEIVKRAKANGKEMGDSMEQELIEYMKETNRKPLGVTELSMDELLKEKASQGLNVLSIETDKDGKQTYKVVKKKDRKEK